MVTEHQKRVSEGMRDWWKRRKAMTHPVIGDRVRINAPEHPSCHGVVGTLVDERKWCNGAMLSEAVLVQADPTKPDVEGRLIAINPGHLEAL